MSTIKTRVIGGINVYTPDVLPIAAINDAIAEGVAAHEATAEAGAAVQAAREAQYGLKDKLIAERTEAVKKNRGSKPLDVAGKLTKAQARVEAAQIEYQAREAIERNAAAAIRGAVLDNLPELGERALDDASLALTSLVVLIEDAEAVRDALYASIGVGHMATRLTDEPGGPIAIQHLPYGYYFSIDAAIEGLNDALSKAHAEYTALRAFLTPGAGKKRKPVDKALHDAPVAPTSVPTTNAGEFTITASADD